MKRNRIVKKALTSALAVLLASASLLIPGCEKLEDYPLYLKTGDTVTYMTKGMFSYYLSQKKSYYLAVMMYNDKSITADTPEVWNTPAPNGDGKTYGEYFFDSIVDEAKTVVTATHILDAEYHYKFPEKYLDYIDGIVEENAITNYGSIRNFEDYLYNFGTTYEDYKKLYLMTANVDFLKDSLYNEETGIVPIPDEVKKAYFAEKYYTIRHAFINTTYTEKMDGTKAPLSTEETERRKKAAESIYSALRSGVSFDELAEEYNRSAFVAVYPDDTYIDTATTTQVAVLGETVKDMEVGEIRMVESEYGVHVIERIETDPEDYGSDKNIGTAIVSAIADEYYPKMLDEYGKSVVANFEILDTFDLASAQMP